MSFSIFVTYDHRYEKTRRPVRSALFKLVTGRLVVRWVTTSESLLLYVFLSSIFSIYFRFVVVSGRFSGRGQIVGLTCRMQLGSKSGSTKDLLVNLYLQEPDITITPLSRHKFRKPSFAFKRTPSTMMVEVPVQI